jgi:RimJ/RimL family protein N-acetyltransferase
MLSFRFADKNQVDLYFQWANDAVARENSYNKEPIDYASHVQWFNRRVQSEDSLFYVFYNEHNEPVGNVRFEKKAGTAEATISIMTDKTHRGKGYATQMLIQASSDFLERNPGFTIKALIFVSNKASFKSFTAAGYTLTEQQEIKGIPSYVMEKK